MFIYSQPSFMQLFRRSRYRHYAQDEHRDTEASAKEGEARHLEKERYLTTAIGFCIRHEPTFRSQFLRKVCNLRKHLAESPIKVLVEPVHWGDLVIFSCKGDFACVVECKLHAKLQPWQNPEAKEFKDGYEKSILGEFKSQRKIHYIILGRDEPLSPPLGNRIKYVWKSWRILEKDFPQGGTMAPDLCECLSALGVPPFMLKNTQTMKLGENTRFLAQAVTLLPDTQIEAGLDETSQQFDCWGNASEGWNLGIVVKGTRKINPSRQAIAWI